MHLQQKKIELPQKMLMVLKNVEMTVWQYVCISIRGIGESKRNINSEADLI